MRERDWNRKERVGKKGIGGNGGERKSLEKEEIFQEEKKQGKK